MENFFNLLLAGIVSGGVISTLLGVFFHQRAKGIEKRIENHYAMSLAVFQSNRSWREKSVSDLLRSDLYAIRPDKADFSKI
jgi:hypothetical protein